ncbi:unnamed protein product [Arctogadus glacialis]
MEEWKKMKDELDHINRKSLKTKDMKTIETAEKLEDLENTSSRAFMFTAIKDLFAFSMRALNLCKTIADTKDVTSSVPQDFPNFEEIIKKQLHDVIPDLLKAAMATLPTTGQGNPKETKEDKQLPVRHTLTVERMADGKASVSGGTAILNFASKAHLDEAKEALSLKYKVSSKSENGEKLDPKLTIRDIPTDIISKEPLEEKLLKKNENMKSIKVVFFDDKQIRCNPSQCGNPGVN